MAESYERVLSYYQEFLQHPDPARQVAWRAVPGQELRFENLLEALDGEARVFSVLDIGSGLGDFFAYAQRTGREIDYLGVDIVPGMVEQARERHPEARFEVMNILEEDPGRAFDLVVCSGGMTVRVPQHERFVRQMLLRMLELSSWAVAVNFQSTRAFRRNPLAMQDPDLYHADPLKLYSMCRTLSPWTSLREDMLSSDVTVYLYKSYAKSLARYKRLSGGEEHLEGVAWLSLERGLPEEALEILHQISETASRRNLCGMAHHRLGQREEARRAYRRALELDGGMDAARLNLETLEG